MRSIPRGVVDLQRFKSEVSVRLSVAIGFLATLAVNRYAATTATGTLTELEVALLTWGFNFLLIVGLLTLWVHLRGQLTARNLPLCFWILSWGRRLRRPLQRLRDALGRRRPRRAFGPAGRILRWLVRTIEQVPLLILLVALLPVCLLPNGLFAAVAVLKRRGWANIQVAMVLGVYGWITFKAYFYSIGELLRQIGSLPPQLVTIMVAAVALPLLIDLAGRVLRPTTSVSLPLN